MKYMLIDVTNVESTAVIAIATQRPVVLLGKVHAAQGRKVIAPPLEGRSFAKLDKLALQYLYWNTTRLVPDDNYPRLIEVCKKALEAMPEDVTPIEDLEREVARLYPETPTISSGEKAPREPGAPPPRPKATSTTGRVWEIADRMLAAGSTDRKAVIAACEAEGINPSTASTQYGKWKASKL